MINKSKKKIAILYSGGKYFGGIETYLLNLFNTIDKDDFGLELLSLGEWELTKRMELLGHKVVVFSPKRVNIRSVNLIGDYLKENQFSLIESQGTVANAYARLISLIYKIPNLVTVHSDLSSDYANYMVRSIYKIIEKLTRFPTVKYIAVSKYLKKQLVKSGLSTSKITVVYNGSDFPAPKARPHKRLVIGSVGRLHPVKGYDLLINAFALIDNRRLRLKIAGVGEELDDLKSLAKNLGISERVEFVGFQKDIYKFLDTVDVYVQSSLSEGFGLSVVEAMSQSLPVVVTPAGSLVEIVDDGKTGIISKDFSPQLIADSITKLVSNYEFSKRMGENARESVTKNFDIKKWTEDTAKVYKEILK